MFGPKGPLCQSCGMPMSKDELGGGTEANGGKSAEFCSYCYRMGKFIHARITLEEMVARVEGRLTKMHMPRFLIKRWTRGIPNVKRWSRVSDDRKEIAKQMHG